MGIMLAGEVTVRVEEVVQPPGVARLYAKRTFSPKYTFFVHSIVMVRINFES